MSLQTKVVIILVTAFGLMIGLHLAIQHWVLLPGFVEAEMRDAEADIDRCVRAIDREIIHTDSTCHDWAAWDEMYEAAPAPSEAFIEGSLNAETFVINRLDLGQIVGTDGRVIWRQAVDLRTKRATTFAGLPAERYPRGHPLLSCLTAEGPMQSRVVRGVMVVGGRPLIVSARPIVTTNHGGPIRGALVLGHFLTYQDTQDLSTQTLVEFTAEAATPAERGRFAEGRRRHPGEVLIDHLSPGLLRASRLYPGLDGEPALVVEATIPREITLRGKRALRDALLVTGVSSLLLFGLVMLLALRVAVLRPLSELSAHAQSIQRSGDYTARLDLGRRDEVGALADTFDQLMLVIAQDIEHRTRTEERLRALDRLNRLLMEHAGDLIAVCDAEGHFTHLSPSFETVLGIATEELLGRPWRSLVHSDDLPEATAALGSLEVGSRPALASFRLLDQGGRPLWFDVVAKVVRESDDAPQQLVMNFQEVTARRRAEEERARLEGQLRQAQKMETIGRLAGGVAHDFNNLLTAISLSVERLLRQKALDDASRETVEVIRQSTERAATLTGRLLAFGRKQVLSPRVVDLNELVEGAVALLRRLIGEDIELLFEPGAELGRVKVDPVQMEQVLVNLAINARDAMAEGGQLTISTTAVVLDEAFCQTNAEARPGPFVRWSVTDSGTGMTPEIRAKLFEPFFTTKEVGRGTGLGLSTVYGIVAQHQGFVTVDTEVGVGTTFTIYLPASAEALALEAPTIEARPVAEGRESILLAEDEVIVRHLCQQILEEQGYVVKAAAGGPEALELVDEGDLTVDLLVTDVVMPKMNGKQLYEHLLTRLPGLRVLYLSGYTADVIAQRGILEEGTHFISKPFTVETLASKVREVLDEERSRS